LAVVITLVLNISMVNHFGYWSLALGTSLAAIFNALFLIRAVKNIIEKRGTHFPIGPLFTGFCAYFMVALSMGLVCFFSDRYLYLQTGVFYEGGGRVSLILGR